MKKGITVFVIMLISVVGFAQDKNKKMTFEVDGKCEMCKMRIEKAALDVSGVKYATWDVASHQLSLVMDERKTNSMKIKSAIAAVGHDTKELKATQEAYDAVHPCCKYREDNTDDSSTHKKHHR
ncbi:heavy-metal-associated domain-containing protein [Muricauda ruestringensis]|uniref:heavy-metal-associated domain-containing protein n=1 Tax=Flagellimonas TaxID=444459 RepID=UPI001CD35A72|nr:MULTISPECIES: heavy-metal-associated domain-containing protein [Allomuricauda]MCA0959074.1 heavy-metal-associated domain-containing protein [Allomuricauda ruestringensis]USD26194.1 heavy-metal-associated domain-containing protein [Allomuricauda aquimarina]